MFFISKVSFQAFGDIGELISYLYEKNAAGKEWKEEIETKVKEVRFYLRGDYRQHTRNQSRVADHCWSHSLSDSSNPKLSAKCDSKVSEFRNYKFISYIFQVPGESHSHDLKCDRCELGKNVMIELADALDDFEKEVEKMVTRF